MNSCAASGFVQGAPELRITRDGRRILNFVIAIAEPEAPYLHVGYLLRPSEEQNITAGMKIAAYGMLKHHCARGLFLAATKIRILETNGANGQTAHAER